VKIGLQIPDFTTPDGPPRLGAVANVWQVTPLEVIAADVIPAVAGL
jgi:hypothetical protein